jgi:hypothetical protein
MPCRIAAYGKSTPTAGHTKTNQRNAWSSAEFASFASSVRERIASMHSQTNVGHLRG